MFPIVREYELLNTFHYLLSQLPVCKFTILNKWRMKSILQESDITSFRVPTGLRLLLRFPFSEKCSAVLIQTYNYFCNTCKTALSGRRLLQCIILEYILNTNLKISKFGKKIHTVQQKHRNNVSISIITEYHRIYFHFFLRINRNVNKTVK